MRALLRLVISSRPGQQFGPRRPVRLIVRNSRVVLDRCQSLESGIGSLNFGQRHCTIDLRNRRASQLHQRLIEIQNRAPRHGSGSSPLHVRRLNRRFKLKAANPSESTSSLERCFSLFNHRRIPQRGFLFGQRHKLAFPVSPRGPARFGVKHQRKQSPRFRLIGQHLGQHFSQKDGLTRQLATCSIGSRGVDPTFGEAGVHGVKHALKPLSQFAALGNPEGYARMPDLRLGSH